MIRMNWRALVIGFIAIVAVGLLGMQVLSQASPEIRSFGRFDERFEPGDGTVHRWRFSYVHFVTEEGVECVAIMDRMGHPSQVSGVSCKW